MLRRLLLATALALIPAAAQAQSAADPKTVDVPEASSGKAVEPAESTESAEAATEPAEGADQSPGYASTVIARRPSPPGTRTEITARELALRGATSLPEALSNEAGVDVHESPKTGGTLQIRGFDERAMLLLFEGIPIREVYDGHFDISALPTFALGAIEIERGMTSLLYGPNSVGGILSLEAPERCARRADVSLFGGNPYQGRLQRYGGTASGCWASGPFSLDLAGGYDGSEGYRLSSGYLPDPLNASYHEDGGLRDGSERTRASLALLARYSPERNKSLALFVDGVHAPRGIAPFEGSGYTRYWKFKRYETLLVGLTGVWGPAIAPAEWGLRTVRGQLYTHLHRDELNDYQDATYEALTTNPLAWFVASSYANESYGAALQPSFALNAGNRLDLALRYQLDQNEQREIRVGQPYAESSWGKPDDFSAHHFSAAAEDSQVFGDWRVLLGAGASGMALDAQVLRGKEYEVQDRLIPGLEGRLVVERSVGESLVLMAAGGRKARLPMLKELFSNSVGGNPDLQSEYAWMAETGFDYEPKRLGIDASVRAFYNSIENLIEKYRDSYENIGRAVTAGAELELECSPIPILQLVSGYRYLYSRDLEHDRGLDYRTPHRFQFTARYLAPWGLTAGLSGFWSAGQEAWYVDSLSGQWVHEQLDGYFLLSANARYDLGVERAGLYLFANARNLLDENYCTGSPEPRAGREVLVGIGGGI